METASLALALNIVELLKITKSVIQTGRDIYGGGSGIEAIAESTSTFDQCVTTLEDELRASPGGKLSTDDDALRQQCKALHETARLIEDEVAKYQVDVTASSANRRFKSLFKSAKYVASGRERIAGLIRKLEQQEARLNTQLNIRTKYKCPATVTFTVLTSHSKRLNVVQVGPNTSIQQLDDLLQTFQNLLIQQQAREAQLEAESKQRALQNLKADVLAGLRYPGIFNRRDMIERAYEETFEWAFKEKPNQVWDPLPAWLCDSNDRKPYWISGKPGAGKSTLIRYIETHKELKSLLQSVQPNDEVHVVSHYFWLASSTPRARSVEGMLRSLLFQVVGCSSVASDITHLPRDFHDWTSNILREELINLTTSAQSEWLIILDGLDEAVDASEVTEAVVILSNLPRVKVLTSSRPLQHFEQAFAQSKKLKVQDLTKNDMHTYLHGRLCKLTSLLDSLDEESCKRFIGNLSERSEGVFLWAKVMANAVLDAATHREPWKDIEKLSLELPTDLDDMYTVMLSRLSPRHRKTALIYFQIMLAFDSCFYTDRAKLSLIEMAAVDLSCPSLRGPSPTLLDGRQILDHVETVRSFIKGRCGNFVEIVFNNEGPIPSQEFVAFMHRSTYDFLREYLKSTTCDPDRVNAAHILAATQVHLLPLADEDERLFATVTTDHRPKAVQYIAHSPRTRHAKHQVVTLWNDIVRAAQNLIRKWNIRLGRNWDPDYWPQILHHMSWIWVYFDKSWDLLQSPDRLMDLIESPCYCSRLYFLADYSWNSCDAASVAGLIEVIEKCGNSLSAEDATHAAVCSMEQVLLSSHHDDADRSWLQRNHIGIVELLLRRAATLEVSKGRLSANRHSFSHSIMIPESPHLSLWSALLATMSSYFRYQPLIAPVDAVFRLLELLVSHGFDIAKCEFQTPITVKGGLPVSILRKGFGFRFNTTAGFCYLASKNKVWAPVANYVWRISPHIDVTVAGYGPVEFNCSGEAGHWNWLSTKDLGALGLQSLEAVVNLTQQPWCPFEPSSEAINSFQSSCRRAETTLDQCAKDITDRIIRREIKWIGEQHQGPSIDEGYFTFVEEHGRQLKWSSPYDLDPDTLDETVKPFRDLQGNICPLRE